MKALTHLAPFPFGYLFDGYLTYIWLVLAAIVFVVVVVLLELRLFERFWLRKSDSAPQKTTPSTEPPPGGFDLSNLKKGIDDLKKQQGTLIDRFISVNDVLTKMQLELARLNRNNDSRDQNYPPQYDKQHTYNGTLRNEYANVSSISSSRAGRDAQRIDGGAESGSDITDLYNASRTDQASRERFREKYKPFFITVANDVERRRNVSVPPDFRQEAHGSYLAVPREIDEALIFPNFTLVIVDAVYGPGALAEVFDCGMNFDHRFSYPDHRVAVPATFRLTGGQTWEVIQKGKLDLGAGQDDQLL